MRFLHETIQIILIDDGVLINVVDKLLIQLIDQLLTQHNVLINY